MKASFLIIPMLLLGAAVQQRNAKKGIVRAKGEFMPTPNKRGTAGAAQTGANRTMALSPGKNTNTRQPWPPMVGPRP